MSITIGVLVALLLIARAYIVSYLVDRPEGTDASPEEIARELRKSFSPRDELEFVTLPEHLEPILDILGERFSGGFQRRQLEMLRFRMFNQPPKISRHATYLVKYNGDESELELEWIINHNRIHIRIAGPEGSLEPVREAVVNSPAQIFSESLACGV